MHPRRTRNPETLGLWYALGRLYSRARGLGNRAVRLGFTATLVSGALVLLSAPLFGTGWAGPFAGVIPPLIGVSAALLFYGIESFRLRGRERALQEALRRAGEDPHRPARDGLGAYHDAQLVLLRSEYEYLLVRGATRSARLFEASFGFAPEDPFETGPLNVAPDTEEMRELRERWERRISMLRAHGREAPELGLREDRAYGVFPREMSVPVELATREAYLTISRRLISERYGRDPLGPGGMAPELRKRIERDLAEHARITGRPYRRPGSAAR
ncbi:hypothetical protein Rxycam_01720 [Rubrobacter xylanophilus DSM 9941]|uniref:hypothetical protein n=1 Tax=Rubrobacter xylanophilus TaxID=49319 RepID=UPI001C63C85C|nr:hypothetical protein [Rubrobacter xylanophilus]QYJ15891.1 hypothetical protein Rxycam_01720 [Rubrobacter xylanophilus DSM 9941]